MGKDRLITFIARMKALGIEVEMFGNYPWVYLDRVNGKKVTETYLANHGFTIAFLPVKLGEDLRFTNITEIFKIIRKYRQ